MERQGKEVDLMGLYLNPGNEAFRQAVTDDIYIDKTKLIAPINQRLNRSRVKYICVSRPRRFGKSMAADMLAAYYGKGCDSGELFAGRKIEKEESFLTHLNRHNVIRLDIQRFLFDESHLDIFIDKVQEAVIRELEEEYGRVLCGGSIWAAWRVGANICSYKRIYHWHAQ